ncbi:MAG: serine/threonine protein kinase [Myxococcales bacterium]|nr:serine/threonine protein kinase [Myxococcales bacterium]
MEPSSIGPYRLLSKVATGGMGEVFRARHPTLDRDVAVKLLRHELTESSLMRDSFVREIMALSRLRSPQTVQLLDSGFTSGDRPYLVTEFLEGEDLRTRLRRETALPTLEAMSIMVEVLKSLCEAHALGLVHRDVKPANIFLQRVPGGATAVKLLDFGVAKIIDEVTTLEATLGAVKGTARYISPEQVLGLSVSSRTDLYAVGCVLYRLISGEAVFEHASTDGIFRAHRNDKPVPLRERCPLLGVPEAVDRLILQCLEKDPLARPQSAEWLLGALNQAAEFVETAPSFGPPFTAPLPIVLTYSDEPPPPQRPVQADSAPPKQVPPYEVPPYEAPLELDDRRFKAPVVSNDSKPARAEWGTAFGGSSRERPAPVNQPKGSSLESLDATRLLAACVLVLTGIGGYIFWRQVRLAERAHGTETAPTVDSSATLAPAPLPSAELRRDSTGRYLVRGRAPGTVNVSVSSGTATFIRTDTQETICVDAVECPMPIGVQMVITRPEGGRRTVVPAVPNERADQPLIIEM